MHLYLCVSLLSLSLVVLNSVFIFFVLYFPYGSGGIEECGLKQEIGLFFLDHHIRSCRQEVITNLGTTQLAEHLTPSLCLLRDSQVGDFKHRDANYVHAKSFGAMALQISTNAIYSEINAGNPLLTAHLCPIGLRLFYPVSFCHPVQAVEKATEKPAVTIKVEGDAKHQEGLDVAHAGELPSALITRSIFSLKRIHWPYLNES